jgi:hypothetical protein
MMIIEESEAMKFLRNPRENGVKYFSVSLVKT